MYVTATSPRFSRGKPPPATRAIPCLRFSALPRFVPRVLADDANHALALDDLAVLAAHLDRGSDFHPVSYLNRYVIRPRVRSYGDSSTFTRSPGRIRMKFMRILPETCASTRGPFSSRS